MARSRVALLALLVLGCNSEPEPLRPDGGPPPASTDGGAAFDGALPPLPSEATYYEHVRPILVANCTMCHQAGGIAPFALETYPQAFDVGERIEQAVMEGVMPPFLADNSGECNTWSNHRGLTEVEIATISAWVAGGKLEGDASIPAPPAAELPTLAAVDISLEMPSTYAIDETDDDDYRCFVVETGLTADTYVTGYDVHPGNPQRVHHVIVYNPFSDAAGDSARARDTGNGYPCFGGPGVDAAPMVLWAPGTGATMFPRGTGVPVTAGRPMIIQVHYNNLVPGSPNDDRTTIDLVTRSSALDAYIIPLWDTDLNLPPRMEEVVESSRQSLSVLPTTVRIHGAFPHMHTLGRRLRVDIHRGAGGDQCLIDIPRWDFGWQLAYWLDEPIDVSPGDAATITCTYNTMERTEMTHWGDGTQDEMCINFVYVTLPL